MWQCLTLSARIRNLGWTQLESTLKIIIVGVENSTFGYNLTIGDLVKRGSLPQMREDPLISETRPRGECFAPQWQHR